MICDIRVVAFGSCWLYCNGTQGYSLCTPGKYFCDALAQSPFAGPSSDLSMPQLVVFQCGIPFPFSEFNTTDSTWQTSAPMRAELGDRSCPVWVCVAWGLGLGPLSLHLNLVGQRTMPSLGEHQAFPGLSVARIRCRIMQSPIKPAAVTQAPDAARTINLVGKCSSSSLGTRAGEAK